MSFSPKDAELSSAILNTTIHKLSTDDEIYSIYVIFHDSQLAIEVFDHMKDNVYKSKKIIKENFSESENMKSLKMYEIHGRLLSCLNRNPHHLAYIHSNKNNVILTFKIKELKVKLSVTCLFKTQCSYEEFAMSHDGYWKYLEPNNSKVFRQETVKRNINDEIREEPNQKRMCQTIQKPIIERRITRSMTKAARSS